MTNAGPAQASDETSVLITEHNTQGALQLWIRALRQYEVLEQLRSEITSADTASESASEEAVALAEAFQALQGLASQEVKDKLSTHFIVRMFCGTAW